MSAHALLFSSTNDSTAESSPEGTRNEILGTNASWFPDGGVPSQVNETALGGRPLYLISIKTGFAV